MLTNFKSNDLTPVNNLSNDFDQLFAIQRKSNVKCIELEQVKNCKL